jgi:hypothetical protein
LTISLSCYHCLPGRFVPNTATKELGTFVSFEKAIILPSDMYPDKYNDRETWFGIVPNVRWGMAYWFCTMNWWSWTVQNSNIIGHSSYRYSAGLICQTSHLKDVWNYCCSCYMRHYSHSFFSRLSYSPAPPRSPTNSNGTVPTNRTRKPHRKLTR